VPRRRFLRSLCLLPLLFGCAAAPKSAPPPMNEAARKRELEVALADGTPFEHAVSLLTERGFRVSLRHDESARPTHLSAVREDSQGALSFVWQTWQVSARVENGRLRGTAVRTDWTGL
jgi:hypothetical protein